MTRSPHRSFSVIPSDRSGAEGVVDIQSSMPFHAVGKPRNSRKALLAIPPPARMPAEKRVPAAAWAAGDIAVPQDGCMPAPGSHSRPYLSWTAVCRQFPLVGLRPSAGAAAGMTGELSTQLLTQAEGHGFLKCESGPGLDKWEDRYRAKLDSRHKVGCYGVMRTPCRIWPCGP